MQSDRKTGDKNWDDMNTFITESREYRIKDEITQKYQVENIEALKNQVKVQNGRVFTIEKWKEEIEIRIKQRKDYWVIFQTVLTLVATIVMAISGYVVMFKK